MLKQHKENSTATRAANDQKDTAQAGTNAPAAVPLGPEVRVDDAGATLCYANFCRVTGTPEELILDFGLNSQAVGGSANVEIKQRLVVNYYTAKRLLHALGLSVHRHEAAFGVLETDVQKRVMPTVRRAADTARPTTAG